MFADISYIPDNSKPNTDIINIITLVRAHQKSKLPINYDAIINAIAAQGGTSHPELNNVKALMYSLRDSDPYK